MVLLYLEFLMITSLVNRQTAETGSDVKNGMTLLCPLLNVRHMGFVVVIETCHTTIIRPPFKPSAPSYLRKTIKLTKDILGFFSAYRGRAFFS